MGKNGHFARKVGIAAAWAAALVLLTACGGAKTPGVEPADVVFTGALPADIHLEAVRGSSGLPDGVLLSRALALGLPMVLVPFSEACTPCLAQLRVADALAARYAGQVRFLGLHVPHTYGDEPASDAVLGTSLPIVRADVVEARAFGFDSPGASVYLLTTSGHTSRQSGLYAVSEMEALVEALRAAN